MKKSINKSIFAVVVAIILALVSFTLVACGKKTPPPEGPVEKAPVLVKDGEPVSLVVGKSAQFTVADYITANDNTVTASSSSPTTATASLEKGVLKITAVAGGTTNVELKCTGAGVTVKASFAVSCTVKYTVTLDDVSTEFEDGGEYTFPAAPVPGDEDTQFDHWSVTGSDTHYAPGDKYTVKSNITVTAVFKRKAAEVVKATDSIELSVGQSETKNVSEYFVTHGNDIQTTVSDPDKASVVVENGKITVNAISDGDVTITLTCGEATVTITLTAYPVDEGAPVFDDMTLDIDLYEKDKVTHDIAPSSVPEGKTFTYAYAVESGVPATFEGNVLTYTPDGTKNSDSFTVTVTATPEGGEAKMARFRVTVTIADTRPAAKEDALTHAGVVDMFGCNEKIDLASNIENANKVTSYTVAIGGDEAVTSEAEFGLAALKQKANGLSESEITLTVKAIYNTDKFAQYVYKVTVIDTSAWRVVNGGFETGDLTGWTPDWETDRPIANVTNADKYFADVTYGKDGTWLLSGACDHQADPDNGRETNVGTLTSSPFTLRAHAVITFKLGAAKNISTGIKVVKEDGTVLAQFYNTAMLATEGKLVQYKYTFDNEEDIQNCKIVIYDYATGDWGLVAVDSIETYVTEAPADAVQAQNVYADKTSLNEAINGAPAEQGDYTTESFNALKKAVSDAQAALIGDYISADRVTELVNGITAAKDALDVRTPTAVENAAKSFKLKPQATREITISDYVDENGLSAITYRADSGDTEKATVSEIEEGKFTVTAVAVGDAHITLNVYYNGGASAVLTIEFTFTVTDQTDPTLKDEAVMPRAKNVDLFAEQNKTSVEIDFAQFIDNPAEVELTYAATKTTGDGEAETVTLESGKYTLDYGSYTYEYTAIAFNVTVSYNITEQKQLTFTYTLNVRDTSAYRVKNGGFENDTEGWTVSEGMGAISTETTYFEGINHGKEGEKFFYGREGKGAGYKGTLESSEFKIGGSGFITYRLGAAGHYNHQYVEIVKKDGTVIARYYNVNFADRNNFNNGDDIHMPNKVSGLTLMKYKADLSAFKGETVKLRITDNWEEGGFGMVLFDDLVTYYDNESDIKNEVAGDNDPVEVHNRDYKLAVNYINQIYNGGFETGNLNGWIMTGDIGFISSANGYWGTDNGEIPFRKEGNFLFEGKESNIVDEQKIYTQGTLTSTTFVLDGSGFVTFRLGGAQNKAELYVEIVDASDNTVLARFGNPLFADNGNYDDPRAGEADNKVSAFTLNKYKADLSVYKGRTLFVRVVDNRPDGGFGMIHADDFVTYYKSADEIGEDYVVASNQVEAA